LKTDVIVRPSYNNIFQQRPTIKSLQKEISISDSLFVLSTINKYEYKLREKDNTELQFILNEWLIGINQEIRKRIVSAYARYSEKTIKGKQVKQYLKSVVLINRISTLRVIEVLCATNLNKEKRHKISISTSYLITY
jgi:hypothetical protein